MNARANDLPQALAKDDEFISDMCRFSESPLSEAQIRKRWRLSEATWNELGDDEQLVDRIAAESARRERLGLIARERAQRTFSRVPTVLTGILDGGDDVSPRHKIEASRELRAI